MQEQEKTIDEARQGEVLILEKSQNLIGKKLFLESYGCAMNFSDSEIVASILSGKGFETTTEASEADVILLNTCSIRENAESRVRQRLHDFKKIKKKNPSLIVGMLGCMAERLKSQLLEEEKLVDLVAGPDSYRDLPNLIETVEGGQKAVNVLLSREETYADINPVRLAGNGVSAFISITRGCDNMCSFCVVPFTRGRERSRDPQSIVQEALLLFSQGYREVTLLGQNVDSYLWSGGGLKKELNEEEKKSSVNFAQLLEKVARVDPELRVRFSTSHPKDMTDEVLHTVAKYENICKYVHLPVQSGSSRILEMMNRGYTREWYVERMNAIKTIIPGCGISTDIISGFCSETEEDHRQTLSLMEGVGYEFAYMFAYSERPGTLAQRQYKDDVPEDVKKRRLAEVIEVQKKLSAIKTKEGVGKIHRVLVEGISKKSKEKMYGRNTQNTTVVFPKYRSSEFGVRSSEKESKKDNSEIKKGEYVNVLATECTTATLIGTVIA